MMNQQNDTDIGSGLNNAYHVTTSNDSPYSRVTMQRAYSAFSRKQNPTALLTLTVKEPRSESVNWQVPDNTLLRKANSLFHWINAELFGRKYLKRGLGLIGFGCIEKQSNHQPHVHLAITSGVPLEKFTKFENVLFNKVKKISLFDKSGIDLQPIESTEADSARVGNYLAKGDRMLTLGADGLY